MDFLVTLHGHNRWLVVVAWIVALVAVLASSLQKSNPSVPRTAVAPLLVLLGLFALQFLLGSVIFIQKWTGWANVPHYRWEHTALMIGSLVLLHLPLRWRRRLPASQWHLRTTLLLLIVGILGFLGVARLPEGWLG
ncbi:MAG: hypothetical protein NZ960_05195 [Candidatus Kapabacteria bacterium]|nr:hypothetical protein [Candidatus Kapabacteria bacterium]MDW8012608.1 hypothetical protein [Bacteroidota bacterium]